MEKIVWINKHLKINKNKQNSFHLSSKNKQKKVVYELIQAQLTFVIKSFARDSKRCSNFCVSTETLANSSQINPVFSFIAVIGSSLTSFQNNLTVFLFFFIGILLSVVFIFCRFGGLGTGGGALLFKGGGGGAHMLPINGGGGGGIPFVAAAGANMSVSSSLPKSVKSMSHKLRGRLSEFISSSHRSSFSDFFASIFGTFSDVGLLRTSTLDFDLASPSLAFDISPVMSPIRLILFSSDGLWRTFWLASFCVKSLTVFSLFSCNNKFRSFSFASPMFSWFCSYIIDKIQGCLVRPSSESNLLTAFNKGVKSLRLDVRFKRFPFVILCWRAFV